MPSPSSRALLALLCLALSPAALRAEDLDALLKKLPASDRAGGEAVCKELVKGGDDVVAKLVALVDGKQDAKARLALHGLAVYTSRPKAEKERAEFASALAGQLDGKHSAAVKAFLLQQLLYCGGPEVVPAVAKCLADETLADPAAGVLGRVGGDKATAALRDALGDAKGKGKVVVLQALGKLRDRKALDSMKKAAEDKDRDTRLAALDALAQLGEEGASDLFLKALPEKPSLEHGRVLNACLVYAERLTESGSAKAAGTFLTRLGKAVKDEKSQALVKRCESKLSK